MMGDASVFLAFRRASDAPAQRFVRTGIVALGFGLLAVFLGQSNSWDLRNYHLYNGWAFWTGRGGTDFAAAQAQTYFNPLLATAEYLLFVNTPPWFSTFLLGVVQGGNFVPVYALARRMLPAAVTERHRWIPLLVALVGCLGATQRAELGGSMGYNLISLPVLFAFAVTFCTPALEQRHALVAGLLVGAATGIKLTAAPFTLGLLCAIPLLARQERWQLFVAAGCAAAAGFFAFDGFWLWHLYREFGNPFHPLFTSVFGGDFAPPIPIRDTRFVPRSLLEWLFYPLYWAASPRKVSDAWFLDLRIPLAFVVVPFLLQRQAEPRLRALIFALAIAYVAWLAVFDVYRYLLPLEMLAPLLVVLALVRDAEPRTHIACGVALALTTLLCRPPGWGHLHEYGATYLDVEVPALPGLDAATIVLAEDEPLAFLALGFPAGARFVRVGGNLLGPPFAEYGMDREARRRLAASGGPLYALLADPKSARVAAVLERQQLAYDGACALVRSNLLKAGTAVSLCPLRHSGVP